DRLYLYVFQCLSRLDGAFRFSMLSRLQAPNALVISQTDNAAKNAASPVRLMPVASGRRLPLFYVV
ncbi:hypothetical protein, partial [Sporosarcina sp. E16_8]|uniref:hypothetical protein n=1 Tax=Sporosarcina sp. E16_8 TaxID=2789295 RepID=UPI001A9105EA